MNGGGVLFPRRGTLPSAGRSPRGQAKFAVGLREGKRRWGDKGPCLCEGHVHTHRHTFSQAGVHYHIPTGAPAWNTDLQACQGKYVWGVHILACTHMHTHAQLLHSHAASKCTHSWAHMGICTKFACSGYICWPKSTLTHNGHSCRHKCMFPCTCIKVWICLGSYPHVHMDMCLSFHPKS